MNLPVSFSTTNTLYFGLGGGFDILGAIPIHETIRSNGVFVSITKNIRSLGKYDPHYCLDTECGVSTLAMMLDTLIERYDIDTIIGIDGGVDCLMHGDEAQPGTVLQDFVSLGAMQKVQRQGVNKYVICVGFGCETDDCLDHYAALKNIATITKNGGFIGSCSLIANMLEYNAYKKVVDQSAVERKSHIQSRVIAAVDGEFGNFDTGDNANLSNLVFDTPQPRFINPLMSIYWFFDFDTVAKQNVMLPHLENTRTISEALSIYRQQRASITKRERRTIPL